MVRFDDEAQRIAAHLRLVHRTLSAMDMEQLSPTQVRWRRALLDELQAYAHRGLFPRNEVLPYRTPVFIDPYGTPCAVGRLMIASGHADLARRIDGAMETAYIQDMGLDEVAQWSVEHGFSQEELEWIQPSYASGVQWTGFAGAPTEHVRVVLKLGNGDMVVAGSFSAVGGLPATNVAVHNGLYFQPLGATGLQGTVTCGVLHEGKVVLAGMFYQPGQSSGDVAIWDGDTWELRSAGYMGKFGYALHVHEGVLHVSTQGGDWGMGGVIPFVSRYVNGQWQAMGGFNGPVLALGSHNGELVAGGEFTANSAGEPMAHVARFDGASWSQLGDGLDANVRALKSVAGSLHAGGDVEVDGAPTFGLARLEGDTWSALPGVQERLMAFHNGNRVIRALADLDGQLVFGGAFHLQDGGDVIGRCIGRVDENGVLGALGNFNGEVNTLNIGEAGIFVGGHFSQVDGHLARTVVSGNRLHVGVGEEGGIGAQVRPNPVADRLFVDVPEELGIRSVYVLDGQGRIVLQAAPTAGHRQALSVAGLASGIYSVVLHGSDGTRRIGRFVKE